LSEGRVGLRLWHSGADGSAGVRLPTWRLYPSGPRTGRALTRSPVVQYPVSSDPVPIGCARRAASGLKTADFTKHK